MKSYCPNCKTTKNTLNVSCAKCGTVLRSAK